MFGVIAPGRFPITEFVPIDATKCVAELINPTIITELTFFMLPGAPIPDGFGAVLYYSPPPFQNWEVIGSINPAKPSGIFRTGWTANETLQNCPMVQLGISIESFDTINNLELVKAGGVDDRYTFAHKIALDMFQYMTSFATGGDGNQYMVVPVNIFDKWMERFDRKYKLDPNFMMKNS